MSVAAAKRIGVLTSGGDAPGMNAAVRAVVRAGLDQGAEVYAIYEGYQGMVDGGDLIRRMSWDAVGGILQQGGTLIGTARCADFIQREGRLTAAYNLLQYGIDGLVVIGGDGSLMGANLFCQEWPELLHTLVETGQITPDVTDAHAYLSVVGLVGSIDNDMQGTDMTIGADTALHRIIEAIDAIMSTAASHQRAFVIEVMGRRCGYLALMAGLACGADWVLIPENPPNLDDWQGKMCEVLVAGRAAGRRASIVVVAEGAQDRSGRKITADAVKEVLDRRLWTDTRVTILGHVQRGGAPTAFDRNLSTMLGYAAVEEVLAATPDSDPCLIGMQGNRIVRSPLMACVERTHAVNNALTARDYAQTMALRGGNFQTAFRILRTLIRALPRPPAPVQKHLRLAILHAGAPAPGMNTAVRAAVRLGVDKGHTMLGVRNGLRGLIQGESRDIQAMDWMSVNGWAHRGGAELGTHHHLPTVDELLQIAQTLERHHINGLLIIGGWAGYQAASQLCRARPDYPAFNIPIVCLPAAIDNDLPGSELSIGADTALNSIVNAVDKIQQSAVASQQCFIVEVMGHECGYLAAMSGLATGAERVYLPEEGVSLNDMRADIAALTQGFQNGKRLGLVIRNEDVNLRYTTGFMRTLFDEEGGELFDAHQAILGHLQQGGNPSPFDRIHATRLAALCIERLIDEALQGPAEGPAEGPAAGVFIGLQAGQVVFHNLTDFPQMSDTPHQRPKEQWWMALRPIAKVMAQSAPRHQL